MEVAPQTTSGSGDAPNVSWADQAEDADSFQRQSTKKRKQSDPKRPDSRRQTKEPGRPLYPFPLQEDARRRAEAQKCYTFSGNLGASLNDFATAAFKKTHPNRPDKEVVCITNQVLCMIAEYHLRCASCGPIMTSPVVPAQVEHLLSPLEEYLSDEDGVEAAYTRDLREFERSRTMRVAVWLHRIDMEASSGRLSQSLHASDHTEGPLLKYFLAPGTSTINFGDVVLRVLVENRADLEEYIEQTQNSLKEAERDKAYLESKVESLCKSHKAETDQAKKRALKKEMDQRRVDMNDCSRVISLYEDHLEKSQRELREALADRSEAQTPPQPPDESSLSSACLPKHSALLLSGAAGIHGGGGGGRRRRRRGRRRRTRRGNRRKRRKARTTVM